MAEAGDYVVVRTTKEERKGTLLESPDSRLILLKLDSGYNIGLEKEDVREIKTIRKAETIAKKKVEQNPNLPKIGMIVTGGTISARLDYKTGGVTWLTDAEELLSFYPEILKIANIKKIEMPFLKATENITWNDWKTIAESAEKMLKDDEIKGIIITQGTDFIHYTAAALSFFFPKLNKPIVLTYSQRSSDRASSDARLNLVCAARAALSDAGEVMLVGHASENDDYCFAHRGTKVRKLHSSRRDAFKSVNAKPIAKIFADKIDFISDYRKKEKEYEADIVFSEKVALLKMYPDQSPEILDFLAKKNKGIIIEASGLGHVICRDTNNWLSTIRKLIKQGTIIGIASQTINGRVDMLVYGNGRELLDTGVVSCEDMLSETAFVKLGWILGHKSWREKAAVKMKENFVGELSERLAE